MFDCQALKRSEFRYRSSYWRGLSPLFNNNSEKVLWEYPDISAAYHETMRSKSIMGAYERQAQRCPRFSFFVLLKPKPDPIRQRLLSAHTWHQEQYQALPAR